MKDFWYIMLLLFLVPPAVVLGIDSLLTFIINLRFQKRVPYPFSWIDISVPIIVLSIWCGLMRIQPHEKGFDNLGEFTILGFAWSGLAIMRQVMALGTGITMHVLNLIAVGFIAFLTTGLFFMYG